MIAQRMKHHTFFHLVRYNSLLILLVGLLSWAGVARAQITTSGSVTNTQTWSGEVTLTGDVTIQTNGFVTIQPGTVIRASATVDDQASGQNTSRIELIVNGGRLVVGGTSESPVLFTSTATTTVAKGDWYGVRFRAGNMSLVHTIVEYGIDGVSVEGAGTLVFDHCTFQKCIANGASVSTPELLSMSNCNFLNNTSHGLHYRTIQPRLILTNCVASTNGNGFGLGVSATLLDCQATFNSGNGIYASGTAMLERVRSENNGGAGAAAGQQLQVFGGSFSRNGAYGMGGSGLSASDAIIEGNRGSGVDATAPARLERCIIRFNGAHGVQTLSGFRGPTTLITGCTVSNNTSHGVFVQFANAQIQNSTISDNSGDGVSSYEGVSAVGSTFARNGQAGLNLLYVLPEGISGNVFQANGRGINTGSSTATGNAIAFSGNDFVDNGMAVESHGKYVVRADGNYWGNEMTAELQAGVANLSKVYDTRDDLTVGTVRIATFLSGPFASVGTTTASFARAAIAGVTKVVSGTLSGAQTWSGTVLMTGDVVLPENVTLTVLPGTRVLADWGADDQVGGSDPSRVELIVQGGRLVVFGTSTSPIRFTPASDTFVRGAWVGLRFLSGSMTLNQVSVDYARNGLALEGGGELNIENCKLQNASEDGAVVSSPGLYTLNNCSMLNNARHGLYALNAGARFNMTNSVASTNGSTGFRLGSSSGLTDCLARENGTGGISGGTGLVLTRVRCESNRNGHGVVADTGLQVVGGSYSRNDQQGISCVGSMVATDVLVESNRSTGIVTANGGTFQTCVIRFNSTHGLQSHYPFPLLIDACTIINNSQYGLTVGHEVKIQRSVISNNRYGVAAANLSIVDSSLVANAEFGAYFTGMILAEGVSGNSIRLNGIGLKVQSSAAGLSFSGNDFVDNGMALDNRGSAGLVANGNFWGSVTTTELQNHVVNLTKIYDRQDDATVGPVTIENYLTAASHGVASITTPPQSLLTVQTGGTVIFTVVAEGSGPLSYQWQINGVELVDDGRIQGARTNRLVIAAATEADAGVVMVSIVNPYGTAVSNPSLLTVTPPSITITQPPAAVSVSAGVSASFTVVATGAGTLSYQWRKDGTNILNATTSTYTIPTAQVSDAGLYSVVVSQGTESVTSSGALLTVSLYHNADYRPARFVLDATEVNRVLSYWRSGSYHLDATGLDGYAAGTGETNGLRHTADYRNNAWVIDATEANRVLSYWRAGGYHADAAGLDGYAAGAAVAPQSLSGASKAPSSNVTVRHRTTSASLGGASTEVEVQLHYDRSLLGLLLRPSLPTDWRILGVRGDGAPELVQNEILWTGAIPPSPIRLVYEIVSPAGDTRKHSISNEVEWQIDGQPNPVSSVLDGLDVSGHGGGDLALTALKRQANGAIQLQFRSGVGLRYELETSPDLRQWSRLKSVVGSGDVVTLEDTTLGTESARFYRVRLLAP